jgi:putative phosphoesterase
MRIAFLSDIHANLPALAAALDSAQRHQANRIVAAGDVVGSGPHPAEVIRILREKRVEVIRGNVERRVLRYRERPKALKKSLKKNSKGHLAWTAAQLGEADWEWLQSLPPQLLLPVGELQVLVVHGSALSDDDYIYPSVTAEGLRGMLGEARPDMLVCGHSHIPFIKVVGGLRILNCGSVGRPVDGDPRGSYIFADFSRSRPPHATIVRFHYPMDDLVADVERRQVPFQVGEEYVKGIKRRGV